MEKSTFDAADPIIDDIADATTVLFDDASANELRNLLTKLQQAVGTRYGVNLTLNVDIFDQEKERCLPLLQTGLSGFGIGEPFQTWNDSSEQRYIADGEMLVVPHDRCPKCWKEWDFKFKNQTCSHCGATLGEGVKVLLDSDVCPLCEEGEISASNPTCSKCGFHVDPKMVTWG